MVKSGDIIKLSIDFSLTKLFKSFTYKWYRVLILNYNSMKFFIVNIESEFFFFFFCFLAKNKIKMAAKNMLKQINPLLKCLLIYFFITKSLSLDIR